jgi:uncharacterized membrane protein YeaQ/YmgE (transglycosylase-associated protein family)
VELLYVTVIGAFIGLVLRYITPGRESYGLFLLPAVGAAATAAIWAALVWAGLKFDGGWIWVAALVGSGAISIVAILLIVRTRRISDQRRLHTLSGGRA